MNQRLSIAFVDDETRILQGLQRMLRQHRDMWDMTFHDGGEATLTALRLAPADVVVSDMRMPNMTGDVLLSRIRDEHPATIRIVLSGQADLNLVYRSIGPVHQYLGKPCSAETLRATISKLAELRLELSITMRATIGKITSLPSPPAVLDQLRQSCRNSSMNLDRVGEIVRSDPAMELRLLQLVNSGFLGSPHPQMDAGQAVRFLGSETMQALMNCGTAFYGDDSPLHHSERMQKITTTTQLISIRAAFSPLTTAAATAAARLLNTGPLALGGTTGDKAQDIAASAYLIGLWGLPDAITETLHGIGPAGKALALACQLVDAPASDPLPEAMLWPESDHSEHLAALRAALQYTSGACT